MSQSLLYHAFGVRDGYEYRKTEYVEGRVEFTLVVKEEMLRCPECGQLESVIRKGKRHRRIQSLPIGMRETWLVTEVPRCHCNRCQKTFEVSPPFAQPYVHFTRGFADLVVTFAKIMTIADVAAVLHLSWETVKAIVKTQLEKTYSKIPLRGLRHIAIDEIHVGRESLGPGMGKTGRFYTLVLDLESGRIVHVSKGRSGSALDQFFRRLRKAKVRIEAVSCDMAAGYWSAVLKHLKGASLVFDRFHIIKLLNERIDDVRRGLQNAADVLGRKFLKGVRYLLFMRAENLPEKRKEQLDKALKFNEPLSIAYYLKEELLTLWEFTTRELMGTRLKQWIEDALATGMPPLMRMAMTLRTHFEQIINYADHPITSGKMEGINNKIKTLNRQAYGFRDDRFFALKLYDLHNSRHKLIG